MLKFQINETIAAILFWLGNQSQESKSMISKNENAPIKVTLKLKR